VKAKRRAKANEATQIKPVEIIDCVDRSLKISKSMRIALGLLGGDSDFGPMLRAALQVQIDEMEEARQGLRQIYKT
jgi:hypothetical protein